jgi:hypothetical protein
MAVAHIDTNQRGRGVGDRRRRWRRKRRDRMNEKIQRQV